MNTTNETPHNQGRVSPHCAEFLPLPVRHAFSATSPRVAFSPYHQFHARAYEVMVGRQPSAFERATAASLKGAYAAMPKRSEVNAFTALSAATGAGKTTAACALMAYLARTEGSSCAYVVPTIAVAEEVLQHLTKLMPGEVAAYTTVHKVNASPRQLDEYSEQGVIPTAQFTEAQFKAARLVVCTHERWRHEVATGLDLGVLKHNGVDRALVVVDEEPNLDLTVVRQPEDVSALASLFADADLRDESRSFGFTTDHHAATALLAMHDCMRAVKDNAVGAFLKSADIVAEADLQHLNALTTVDLSARIGRLSLPDRAVSLEYFAGTVAFLKLAAQGRVFYSRGEGGAFFAYGYPVKPLARHLILDGTADLNGMYAVGQHVTVVKSVAARYDQVKLHAVAPPRQFRDRMRTSGILRNDTEVEAYFDWFMPFLLEHTKPGQHVLVYAKKALLAFGVHKLAKFDDSGKRAERYTSTLQGRTIHWCSFGRGRGLNSWKHCTAYFRLGDFMLKRAHIMARIAATTGETYTPADLRRLNSGRLRDHRVTLAQSAHLATTNKQDAARICIRHLDDDGKAQAADLFMVDCHLPTLESYRERMFPGAAPYTLLKADHAGTPDAPPGSPRGGAAARVADLLLTTELPRLTVADLTARCGLRPTDYTRTTSTHLVLDAMQARGWSQTTRKALGIPGKGKVLVRST